MAEGNIDKRKPIHLDFFTRLLEIHFPEKSRFVVAYGPDGLPVAKAAWSESPNPISPNIPPRFGSRKELPTPTSPIPSPAPHITNHGLYLAPPVLSGIDNRGYTTFLRQKFTTPPSVVPTGAKLFFDGKGKSVSKVPPSKSRFGKLIHRIGDSPDSDGIYAYNPGYVKRVNKSGKTIWKLKDTYVAVNYDKDRDELIATDNSLITRFDLDGTKVSQLDYNPDGNEVMDISVDGKIYLRTGTTDDSWGSIIGLSQAGKEKWKIPGELFDGAAFQSIIAAGKDYIFVATRRQEVSVSTVIFTRPGDLFPSFITTTISTRIWIINTYDANTGSKIAQTNWGNDITRSTVSSINGGVNTTDNYQDAYADVVLYRSNHYPDLAKPPP